jgi:hypothetical protein
LSLFNFFFNLLFFFNSRFSRLARNNYERGIKLNTIIDNNGLLRHGKYPGRIVEGSVWSFCVCGTDYQGTQTCDSCSYHSADDDDDNGIRMPAGTDCRWGLIKIDGMTAIV